jgi:hypothetical protein
MTASKLTRLPDWPARLSAFVSSRRDIPYAYGVNDCACFAQESVIALTGTDPLPGIERPKSWLGAARFLIANGWEDVEEMITAVLGPPLASPRLAQRGDIVSFASPGGERHLAVCTGGMAATPGGLGIEWVPLSEWRSAWKV